MYARRGEGGRAKAYTKCTRREGVHTYKYVRKSVPFLHVSVIFSYARYFYHTLLSLVFHKTFAVIMFLSPKFLQSISLWKY